MSLFSSIQMGANTLQAMQIGLHVVGNNIANANTPGYIREEVLYSPAPVQQRGGLTLGTGVEIDGIVQKIDEFLTDRLRGAASDRASADVQRDAFNDLEALIGELSSTDLSTSLSNFFNSIDDIAVGAGDTTSLRNLAIGAGETLTADVRRFATRAFDIRNEFNTRIRQAGSTINNLTEQIRELNLRITNLEAGGASGSDAGGLRTERQTALKKLAELIDIQVNEQPSGSVNISVGGKILVFEGTRRELVIEDTNEATGEVLSTLRFLDNNDSLELSGGQVHGLLEARDGIVGDFVDNLDEFSQLLAFEFNKLYSQGQGAAGFDSLTSVYAVSDPTAPLDAAGLPFTPTQGSFQLLVANPDEGTTRTHDIFINLDGLDTDTSLTSLAADIDAIDGVSASIDTSGRLVINSDSGDVQFAFQADPANESGVLAALGLNTFFTGTSARDLGVNRELTEGFAAANKFAASLGSVGQGSDNENALRLAEFYTTKLAANGGASLATSYEQLINDITQRATIAASVAEGFSNFENTLLGEEQAISGVNIDEEAIDMITLQRTYQASARFIQTISELLEVLVNL